MATRCHLSRRLGAVLDVLILSVRHMRSSNDGRHDRKVNVLNPVPAEALSYARVCACLIAIALTSCGGTAGDDAEPGPRIGSVKQALTDTDSDSLDDGWEVTYFGNLSQTGSGDFDSDGMTNLEEYS